MGCDIHLHSEVKINGIWHHYAEYNCIRSYQLFAKMANVRNYDEYDIDPLASEPRGMPDDPSFLTAYICKDYGEDGHSHSWLSASEIRKLESWLRSRGIYHWEKEYWGYFFGNTWGGFEPGQHGVEDVRFVFWFDN